MSYIWETLTLVDLKGNVSSRCPSSFQMYSSHRSDVPLQRLSHHTALPVPLCVLTQVTIHIHYMEKSINQSNNQPIISFIYTGCLDESKMLVMSCFVEGPEGGGGGGGGINPISQPKFCPHPISQPNVWPNSSPRKVTQFRFKIKYLVVLLIVVVTPLLSLAVSQ